jgi:O-antigen/teichoic acid export membrane protein
MADVVATATLAGAAPIPVGVTRLRIYDWGMRGTWAIADQALFALSNLLLNVLLARWLPPAEYGAFVAAYTGLLLISVLHTAFLTEPMLIFGANSYAACFPSYFNLLRRYHWRVTIASAVALAAVAGMVHLAGNPLLARAFVGAAIASPCVLLAWLNRRACYTLGQPRRAAIAGAGNLVLVLGVTAVLAQWQLLSVLTAQLLLAGGALLAAAMMRSVTTASAAGPLSAQERRSITTDHWRYGRWSAASGLVLWAGAYIYYLALPAFGGLEDSGALRALNNLVMPLQQSDAALITLLTPVFVRARNQPGGLARTVKVAALGFGLEAIIYWIVLILYGGELLRLFYGGVYRYDISVLILVGALPFLNGLFGIFSSALRARGQNDALFWATAVSMCTGMAVGLTALASHGVSGALLGLVVGAAVQTVATGSLLARKEPQL